MRKIILMYLSAVIFCLTGFAIADAQGDPYQAGKFEFGLKAGLGLTKMPDNKTGISNFYLENEIYDEFNVDSKYHKGFLFGGMAVYHISENISLQAECLYTSKGVEIENKGYSRDDTLDVFLLEKEKMSLTYLEIPLLVKYCIPAGKSFSPALYAGTALSFKLSAQNDINYDFRVYYEDLLLYQEVLEGKPDIDNIKSTDFGLVFGGEFGFRLGSHKLLFDIRYTMGMTELFEDVDPDDIPSVTDKFPPDYPQVNSDTGKAPSMKNNSLVFSVGFLF
ncbi:MAG: porin family protein [Candidatus Zixiibacteriota bacterium]